MKSAYARTASKFLISTLLFVILVSPVEFAINTHAPTPILQVAAAATDTSNGTNAQKSVPDYNPVCSIIRGFSLTQCLDLGMSWFGSLFIAFGGLVLRLAGAFFDFLITHVIIDFKGTLDSMGATDAIKTGWTVFRDFSNILIIGIFTFIAVSIILGLKEFGQKKLIANVLIVAVLINFSLLFTKTIIDISNFTAYVIYKQMAAQSQTFDISQAFLSPMKITSVWKDKANMTDAVLRTSGSGAQAFFSGLAGGLLLLAVAAVLFYGCFLVAARAILLIFLMLTAALAFATYLLPNLQNSQYGWSEWWKSLINAAVFAPLLMLFLAISLSIVTAANSNVPKNIGLGDIIADPQAQTASGNGWTIMTLYLIGVGTLFLSLRFASSFAGKISGFKMASVLPAGLAVAASRLGGMAGRNTLGWAGQKGFQAAQRRGWQNNALGRSFMSGLNTLQSSSFDAMTTKAAQKAVKGIGGVAFGDKLGKGGLVGVQKRKAEEAHERAKMLLDRTDAEKKRAEDAAAERTKKGQQAAKDEIKQTRENISKEVNAAKDQAKNTMEMSQKAARETAKDKIAEQQRELDARITARAQAETEARVAEQEAADSGRTAAQRAEATARASAARTRLMTEDEKIRNVRKEIDTHHETLARLDKDMADAVAKAGEKREAEIENVLKDRETALAEEVTDAKKAVSDKTALGQRIAINRLGTGYGTFGSVENDPIAQRVKSAARNKEKKENLRELNKILKEEGGEEEKSKATEEHKK